MQDNGLMDSDFMSDIVAQDNSSALSISDYQEPDALVTEDDIADNALSVELAQMDDSEQSQMYGELVGGIKVGEFMRKVADASVISQLAHLRKSKLYKNRSVKTTDGRSKLRNWGDFCEHVLGSSKSKVNEQIANLTALGDEMFNAANKAGIPTRVLRQTRKLEPEQIQALESQVKQADNPKEIAAIFETMAATNAELRQEIEDRADAHLEIVEVLENQITKKEEKVSELKGTIKAERSTRAIQFTRDWPDAVAQMRYTLTKESEAMRIHLNNLYAQLDEYQTLSNNTDDTLTGKDIDAAGDCLAVVISSLAAEVDLLKQRFVTNNPGVLINSLTINPESNFTEDENKRLLHLRHQLMKDNVAGLEANRREVATMKRGPAPKHPDLDQ